MSELKKELVDEIRQRASDIQKTKGFEMFRNYMLTKSKRQQIYRVLEEFDHVDGLAIGDGNSKANSKYLVFRYHDDELPEIDRKEVIKEANELYKNKEYEKAIEKLRPLLYEGKPPHYLFHKLGISYMKLNKLDEAIMFLTLANASSSEINLGHLIARLNKIKQNNLKNSGSIIVTTPAFKEFDDNDRFYGIENFEQINDYIELYNVDVETACEAFNMSEEDTDVVKLIYAKLFYIQSNPDKGNQFLKSIERKKGKTQKVMSIYQNVINNKKLYLRRPVPAKLLSLQIKPQ